MDDTITKREKSEKNNLKETKGQTDLRGEFIQGKEDIISLCRDWDKLFSRAKDAPAFFSSAWIQTFIKHNRFKGKPCLIAVWKGPKLVALLPFAVRSLCGIRIGCPIGTSEPSFLGLLLDPEYPEAAAVVAETWIREKAAHAFHNKHLSSLDSATYGFITELNRRGFACKYGYERICHYIELGCSFDEYLKKKITKGKRRYKLRYEEKKLYKSGNVKVTRYIGKDITPEILKRIATIQNESWMKKRSAAVLGQPFYQNLLSNMSEAGLGSVWLMTIDGDDASFAYTFITHGKLYYHWPAFKLKYESGLSIGQMLLMHIIRDACNENIQSFDFEHGDAEYKRFWSNKIHQVFWVVTGRSVSGHIAILCFRIAWWFAGQKKLFQVYRRLRKYRKIITHRLPSNNS
jgi:CelD/BcsL family acetyltransferase involved in cellulose biosynthesis